MIMRWKITIVPWDKRRVAPRRNFNKNKPLKERLCRNRGPKSNYGVPVVFEVWFRERILDQRIAGSQVVLESKKLSNPQHLSQHKASPFSRQERAGLR